MLLGLFAGQSLLRVSSQETTDEILYQRTEFLELRQLQVQRLLADVLDRLAVVD